MSNSFSIAFSDYEARADMTRDEVTEVFNSVAACCEEVWIDRGYIDHICVAKAFAKYVPENKRSTVKILDVAAATGLVAQELWKEGFRCIDAIDPSEGMRQEAMKKNVYRNYYLQYLNENSLQSKSYDGIVLAGGFNTGLLPHTALTEMVRLVKHGGIICFELNDAVMELEVYRNTLAALMSSLAEEGSWKLLSKTKNDQTFNGCPGNVYTYTVTAI